MSKEHWNSIFTEKTANQLGWYEQNVNQTLKFITKTSVDSAKNIFVAGAGTSLLVEQLLSRFQPHSVVANDLSDAALQQLQHSVNHESLRTFCHDLSQPFPQAIKDITFWVDRAVLHFLIEEGQIRQYFENLKSCLLPGGYVLFAEFSKAGASSCAGLPVRRYNIEELSANLGTNFELIAAEDYTFINPFGQPKPYVYALFKRS